ncbi:hypothetical protein ES703_23146 [subsurface metagenome]
MKPRERGDMSLFAKSVRRASFERGPSEAGCKGTVPLKKAVGRQISILRRLFLRGKAVPQVATPESSLILFPPG